MNTATVDTERAVLHSIILGRAEALRAALAELPDGADSFADENHRTVFETAYELDCDSVEIEPHALTARLASKGIANPSRLLSAITSGDVPTSANVREYARALRDGNTKQQLSRSFKAALRGCDNGQTPGEILENLRNEIGDLDIEPKRAVLPTPVDMTAFDIIAPDREFVFDSHFARGTATLIAACGGRSKSWVAWILAVSAASGRALLPTFDPSDPKRVLIVAGEDDALEFHRRFNAICEVHRLAEHEIEAVKANVRLYAGRGFPLVELNEKTHAPETTAAYAALEKEIAKFKPDLIVVDPLALFHAVDENSNPNMAAVIDALAALGKIGTQAGVIALHHTNKTDGDNVTRHAARGASALHDGARAMMQLTELTPDELNTYGLGNPAEYVKLSQTKSNYSPLPPRPVIFQRRAGGCLVELDVIHARETARVDTLNRGAQIVADVIDGAHLTAREIAEPSRAADPEHAEAIRADLDSELKSAGIKATREAVKRYLEHGIAAGFLIEISVSTGGRERRELTAKANTREYAP
jgi:RecA-family ATPase